MQQCRWRWTRSGVLDVVVNNAGYGDVAPFEQLSSERFKELMDTNFYGVVNMTRAALPIMRKQRAAASFKYRRWAVAAGQHWVPC